MTLSSKEKEKIREEELYRKSVSKDLHKSGISQNKGLWVSMIFVVVYTVIIISNISKSPITTDLKTDNNLLATPTLTQEEKDKKNQDLADTFCSKRASGNHINLDDFSKMLESTETVTLHNTRSASTTTSCKKVATLCLDYWSEDNCQRMAEEKIWIGMEKNQLYLSWGVPSDKNNTVGSWGVHTQWVYGDFGPYVYLEGKDEDSLVVTSWQD